MQGARRRAPIAAVWIVVTLLAAGATGSPATGRAGASARAYAISVVVGGGGGSGTRTVSAPPNAVEFGGGFAYPADGSILKTGSFTASTTADAGQTAYASASAEVTSVSLFGGEVTASDVAARAKASAKPGTASGDLSGAGVSGLTVAGAPVGAGANGRVSLGDWGYAIVLAQGVSPGTDSYRGYVIGLDVHLTADHGGLPAGSEILIGFAEATVQAPPPPPKVNPPTPLPPGSQSTGAGGDKKPSANGKGLKAPEPQQQASGLPPKPFPTRLPPKLEPRVTAAGYVFPVYGPSSFTDDFGAPRADTGWHHGIDIFAPLGAPILAVARGTVFSVGWNDVGGNRFWLRDGEGNEFYYAHLSAFTPLAVNGAHVDAGDVIGFLGNTGDAVGTPFHLHFEFHQVSLLYLGYDGVINPYRWLTALQHLQDVRYGAAPGWAPAPTKNALAPMPGAILLEASDISSANGLQPGSLQRAFAPASAEGDGALLGPAKPSARARGRAIRTTD